MIVVSDDVAVLVRSILDVEAASIIRCRSTKPQSCTQGQEYEEDLVRSRQVDELTANLLRKHGPTADEALVVLLAFYVGESNGEDILFAITARGRRMLPWLRKYDHHAPTIKERSYPQTLLLPEETRTQIFNLAIDSVVHGRDLTPD
jgi:hypothetical protein